jgi:hypothetical protein
MVTWNISKSKFAGFTSCLKLYGDLKHFIKLLLFGFFSQRWIDYTVRTCISFQSSLVHTLYRWYESRATSPLLPFDILPALIYAWIASKWKSYKKWNIPLDQPNYHSWLIQLSSFIRRKKQIKELEEAERERLGNLCVYSSHILGPFPSSNAAPSYWSQNNQDVA